MAFSKVIQMAPFNNSKQTKKKRIWYQNKRKETITLVGSCNLQFKIILIFWFCSFICAFLMFHLISHKTATTERKREREREKDEIKKKTKRNYSGKNGQSDSCVCVIKANKHLKKK